MSSPPKPPLPELPPSSTVKSDNPELQPVDAATVVIDTDPPSGSTSHSARRSMARRGDGSKWWIFNVVAPLLILATGAGILWLLGEVKPSRRPPADETRTGILKSFPAVRTIAIGSLANSGKRLQLAANGQVVPYHEAEVAAEVAGRIISKQAICEAGQFVRAGDKLMQIDRTDMELEVENLQRSQEQAYEALKEIDQEISGNDRLVEVAKRDVQLQIREVRRQRALPEGFNRASDIDAAEKSLLNAEQALVTLENRISLLKAQRSRQEAAERQAATQLKGANMNLKRTTILAPIDGMIVRENVDVDSFVQRGTSLVTIETIEKVEVESKLRVDQLHWVLNQKGSGINSVDKTTDSANRFAGYELPKTDAIISYEVSGLENQVYYWMGQLVSYDGIGMDPQTRTIPVRILVDNPQQNVDADGKPIDAPGSPALVRGMFVSIALQITPTENLVIIPASAMQPGNRVLQFVADDSVLMVQPSRKKSDGDMSKDANAADGSDAAKDGDGTNNAKQSDDKEPDVETDSVAPTDSFDPTKWTAGRIVLKKNITPIDSLSTPATRSSGETDELVTERFWVCNVPKDSIVDGSLVVVSPVGSFDGNSMPARTEIKMEP